MDYSKLSASDARDEILNLTDRYSFETICREMIIRMSGDEAREFLEYFNDCVVNN